MAIEQNSAVEVQQVENGYVVKATYSVAVRDVARTTDPTMVFQTFSELVVWMSEHFTHRAKDIAVDG